MWPQLRDELKQLWQETRPRVRRAAVASLKGLRAVWRVVRPPLVFVLQVLAALVILFEEWGWQPLMALLGRLARFKPWAMLEAWIAGLPPYGALAVFALPMTLLFPLKFVALYLLADGRAFAAGLVFLGAKIASTALLARIFLLTKPALMRISWFARAYNWFMPWKEHFFAMIRASWPWRYGRMVKNRLRLETKQAWTRWTPSVQSGFGKLRAWLASTGARMRLRLREGWRWAKPVAIEQAARVRVTARRWFSGSSRDA